MFITNNIFCVSLDDLVKYMSYMFFKNVWGFLQHSLYIVHLFQCYGILCVNLNYKDLWLYLVL